MDCAQPATTKIQVNFASSQPVVRTVIASPTPASVRSAATVAQQQGSSAVELPAQPTATVCLPPAPTAFASTATPLFSAEVRLALLTVSALLTLAFLALAPRARPRTASCVIVTSALLTSNAPPPPAWKASVPLAPTTRAARLSATSTLALQTRCVLLGLA